MSDDLPWSAQLADDIGHRVGEARKRAGFSAQELSDALAEVGVTIARPVLSNLENGRRHTISVPELVALAYVLRVAPVLLLFPIESRDGFEIIPGQDVAAWDAAKWFTGEAPFPRPELDEGAAWRSLRELAKSVQLYREHDRTVANCRSWARKLDAARAEAPSPDQDGTTSADAALGLLDGHSMLLRAFRSQMEASGVSPPPLPPDVDANVRAAVERQERTGLQSLEEIQAMQEKYFSESDGKGE